MIKHIVARNWLVMSLPFFVGISFINLDLLGASGEVLKWGTRLYFTALGGLGILLYWRQILQHVTDWPMYMVLFGWFLFTAIVGVNPQLGILRWALMVQFMLLAACFAASMSAAKFHKMVFYSLAPVTILNALIFVLIPSLGMDEREGFAGVIGDKNLAGQFYVISIVVSLYYAFAVSSRRERWFAATLALVGLAFLIETRSKTSIGLGLLAILACGLYYAASRNGRMKAAMLVSTALSCSAVVLWAGIHQIDLDSILYALEDVSFSGRTTIWRAALTVIAERPWIGQGFGSFWQTGSEVNGFQGRQHLDIFEVWIDDAKVINQSHNGYLDLLLSVGIIGAVLSVGAILLSLRQLQRLIVTTPGRSPDRFAFMMAHSCIVVLLLNNLLESTLFYSPIYSVGGMLLLLLVQSNWWWAAGRTARSEAPLRFRNIPTAQGRASS